MKFIWSLITMYFDLRSLAAYIREKQERKIIPYPSKEVTRRYGLNGKTHPTILTVFSLLEEHYKKDSEKNAS